MATPRASGLRSLSSAKSTACQYQFLSWHDPLTFFSELLILPPNTTHIFQALDKLFVLWHNAYEAELQRWRKSHPGSQITKDVFVTLFESAWPGWARPRDITTAFARVGWKQTGLDMSVFPDDADCFKLSYSFSTGVR